MGATVAALANAEDLPGPQDAEAVIPPTLWVFVRRVPAANLWIWFTATASRLVLYALTAQPPDPVEPW